MQEATDREIQVILHEIVERMIVVLESTPNGPLLLNGCERLAQRQVRTQEEEEPARQPA